MGEPKRSEMEDAAPAGGEPEADVLVVEADAAIRDWMCEALHGDYALRFADGVREALAALSTRRPVILVSEVDLRDGDGFELCQQTRRLPALRELPILLFTTRSSTSDKVHGFQSGADDYVVKPSDGTTLRARLRLLQRIKRIEPPVLLNEHS